jgi:REP element-mobilizing transposase RayT
LPYLYTPVPAIIVNPDDMSDKFQDKYRIPSARADWWDYGWNAAYFVTICTAHREHYFGEIVNGNGNGFNGNGIETGQSGIETGHCVETGHCPVSTNPDSNPDSNPSALIPRQSTNTDNRTVMQLSEIGKLAAQFWWTITDHFPFVKLDAFVVMPNHIHGILVIDKTDDGAGIDDINVETGHCPVSTQPTPNTNSAPEPQTPGELRYRNQGKDTLSSIIGSYKSIVTKLAHRIHADFEWQERFHDHIIRDVKEFSKIANYIENNIVNWRDDNLYN